MLDLKKKNAMVRTMARIGSGCARMVFKKKRSEFNSLQTGPNGLCLWPNVEAEMSKTCAAAISYKSGR